MKDDKTLRELHVTSGTKMMVVGSTLGDVITVQPPSPGDLKDEPKAEGERERVWLSRCTALSLISSNKDLRCLKILL